MFDIIVHSKSKTSNATIATINPFQTTAFEVKSEEGRIF